MVKRKCHRILYNMDALLPNGRLLFHVPVYLKEYYLILSSCYVMIFSFYLTFFQETPADPHSTLSFRVNDAMEKENYFESYCVLLGIQQVLDWYG